MAQGNLSRIHRDLGSHTEQLKQLKELVGAQNAQITAMQLQLAEMHDIVTSSKASWRTLAAVSGIAAALATGVRWLWEIWVGFHSGHGN
jgi:hypothetical protein